MQNSGRVTAQAVVTSRAYCMCILNFIGVLFLIAQALLANTAQAQDSYQNRSRYYQPEHYYGAAGPGVPSNRKWSTWTAAGDAVHAGFVIPEYMRAAGSSKANSWYTDAECTNQNEPRPFIRSSPMQAYVSADVKSGISGTVYTRCAPSFGTISHIVDCKPGSGLSDDFSQCICAQGTYYVSELKKCVSPWLIPPDEPNKGGGCSTDCPPIGNPINPGNGNKFQRETDYANSSGELSLARFYNGGNFLIDAYKVRRFGVRWVSSYENELTQEASRTPNQNWQDCWRDGYTISCIPVPQTSSEPIPQTVAVSRPDGKRHLFSRVGNSWLPDSDVAASITPTYNSGNTAVVGWTYRSATGDMQEYYDAGGKLLFIKSRSGLIQRLTYSNGLTNDSAIGRFPADAPTCARAHPGAPLIAGRLLCVTDHWGRQIHFEYDDKGRVVKLIDPADQDYLYEYDGPSGGCVTPSDTNRACSANNMTAVTYPDGKKKIYHYNEYALVGGDCAGGPVGNGFGTQLNLLTGITDENNVRFARWSYDCEANAIMSEHAGGVNKVTASYVATPDYRVKVATVTYRHGQSSNPQTYSRRLDFQKVLGILKNTEIDSPCVGCGDAKLRSYDANGNVTGKIDWKDVKTCYAYDLSRNLETARIEAASSTGCSTLLAATTLSLPMRKIVTQWHADYRLPLAIAEPLRITRFEYDPSGNLLNKTVHSTNDATGAQGLSAATVGTPRRWQYTYNDVGQLLSAKGPRTDIEEITRYAYDQTTGNLASVTNPAGHSTRFTNYDAHGRAGRIVQPNDVITEMTYSSRGWLTSKIVTAGSVTQMTLYDYDDAGQLKYVTLPDGSSITYTYDDAHRLTKIADSQGNSIEYVLDLQGNRLDERVKDPAGALASQVTRVYDTMNRLTQMVMNDQAASVTPALTSAPTPLVPGQGPLAPVTVALSPPVGTVYNNQTFVLTATVTGTGNLSGAIKFLHGDRVLGTAGVVNGAATWTFPKFGLALGSHTFSVSYTSNTYHEATVSSPLTVAVMEGRTVPNLSFALPAKAYQGTTLDIVGTMSSVSPDGAANGTNAVNGSVTLRNGSTVVGTLPVTCPVGGACNVTFAVPLSNIGSYEFVMDYSGNTVAVPVSVTRSITVNAALPQITAVTLNGPFVPGTIYSIGVSDLDNRNRGTVSYTVSVADSNLAGAAVKLAEQINTITGFTAVASGPSIAISGRNSMGFTLSALVASAGQISFQQIQEASMPRPGTRAQFQYDVIRRYQVDTGPATFQVIFERRSATGDYFREEFGASIQNWPYPDPNNTARQVEGIICGRISLANPSLDPTKFHCQSSSDGESQIIMPPVGETNWTATYDVVQNLHPQFGWNYSTEGGRLSEAITAILTPQAQITRFYPVGIPVPGTVYTVSLDGANYSYRVTTADTTLEQVSTGLAAAISVNPQYIVRTDFSGPFKYLFVEHGTVNQPFATATEVTGYPITLTQTITQEAF